jgi:hypothetical protein
MFDFFNFLAACLFPSFLLLVAAAGSLIWLIGIRLCDVCFFDFKLSGFSFLFVIERFVSEIALSFLFLVYIHWFLIPLLGLFFIFEFFELLTFPLVADVGSISAVALWFVVDYICFICSLLFLFKAVAELVVGVACPSALRLGFGFVDECGSLGLWKRLTTPLQPPLGSWGTWSNFGAKPQFAAQVMIMVGCRRFCRCFFCVRDLVFSPRLRIIFWPGTVG